MTQVQILRAELDDALTNVSSTRREALARRLVAGGWRNFDTDHLVFMPEIARQVGVTMANAHKWWRRHATEVPEPILSVRLPHGAILTGWDEADAELFAKIYSDSKAAREGYIESRRR